MASAFTSVPFRQRQQREQFGGRLSLFRPAARRIFSSTRSKITSGVDNVQSAIKNAGGKKAIAKKVAKTAGAELGKSGMGLAFDVALSQAYKSAASGQDVKNSAGTSGLNAVANVLEGREGANRYKTGLQKAGTSEASRARKAAKARAARAGLNTAKKLYEYMEQRRKARKALMRGGRSNKFISSRPFGRGGGGKKPKKKKAAKKKPKKKKAAKKKAKKKAKKSGGKAKKAAARRKKPKKKGKKSYANFAGAQARYNNLRDIFDVA